jgi:hypothetical protein
MKNIALYSTLALVFVANSYIYEGHAIESEASKLIAVGIKA